MSFVLASAAIGCEGGGGNGGEAGANGGAAGATACDVPALYTKYFCATPVCHSSVNPAANFDMQTPGWEKKLVGKVSAGGDSTGTASICAGMGLVYLKAGSSPATGLFMDKISKKTPPCGVQMPNLPIDKMSTAELACVQAWADALVAATQ